jgi:hypothetical protein
MPKKRNPPQLLTALAHPRVRRSFEQALYVPWRYTLRSGRPSPEFDQPGRIVYSLINTIALAVNHPVPAFINQSERMGESVASIPPSFQFRINDQEREGPIDQEKKRVSKINNPCCLFDGEKLSFEHKAKVAYLLFAY